MQDKIMRGKWDDLHKQERFRPKYPSGLVVKFILTQFPKVKRNKIKILDLGCGAGRHVLFLAKEGFNTYATDISEDGLKCTRSMLRNAGLKAYVKKSTMTKQPFLDDSFDGIISYGVLQYNTEEGYQKSIAEMYRILKKGGQAFIYTRTTDDYTFGKGQMIAKNTFVLDTKGLTVEDGMVVCYLEKNKINTIFRKFSNISIKREDIFDYGSETKESHWIIYLKKK